ncbi:hypothetical protein SAMN06265222_105138 [Neorhodopirellula lusitana]|uniref:Uncharacterized protein n=1 Tax=Neorhodopirellula lusitana TaxID=445327 RepID=A0ABY1Q1G1_9BACT|nr:hypothetical protein SAMN06265222_105138 [Neorhodopirellula lusitana]
MDSPGNHAVVGWLLGRDAGQLLIKKVDGSVSKVSPNHLWESDRNYAWQATEPRVSAEATVWLGRVVAVMDGDTLAFEKLNREKANIRLDGIDAPESGVVRFDDRAARRCSKLSAIEKQT